VELKTLLPDRLKEKTQLLAVSLDTHEQAKALIAELEKESPAQEPAGAASEKASSSKVDFPLLQDQNHRVIDRYGLLNPEGKGWPHPATYVIDGEGIVRWKFVEVDYKVRPTNAMVLNALRALP
jgi:peroxiredoxin